MKRFVDRIVILMVLLLATSCASSQSQGAASGAGGGAFNALSAEEQAQGWRLLFDGRSLEGWTNRGMAEWRVVDGTLTPTPGTGQGHLATNQSYGNFQLRLEFFADSTSNSGVYFRVPASDPATVDNAFEAQIFDAGPVWQTGAIVNIQAALTKVPTANRWSTMNIDAMGTHLVVRVNGVTVNDVDVREAPRLPSGPIILAPIGQGELKFRNIRIRAL